MSVQELAELNDLSPRAGLQRGQSIRIPKTVTEYKVKSGDSLIRLASKFGIDTSALAEMNEIKPNASLRIGSIIKVPNL
ncbi:Spore germination protein YaaH [compost metagenome]